MANGKTNGGNLQPEAIAAGVAVALGIAWLATRKSRKCKKLSSVWHEDGPLYMTKDAFVDANDYIRHRVREYIIAPESVDIAGIQLGAANHLEECNNWGRSDKMSDNQKQVWKSLGALIAKTQQEAQANTEAFLASVK